LIVDPKWSGSYAKTWPFEEARIDGTLIDFEDYVDEETSLSGYYKNYILGIIGDQAPNSHSVPSMSFVVGNALLESSQTKHCSFDMSDCYSVRTLPMISDVSANSGSTAGGQHLTISGHGLDSGAATITVDGVACEVTEQDSEYVTCETGSATGASSNSNQPGQHGLKRSIYTSESAFGLSTITSKTHSGDQLLLTTEISLNREIYQGNVVTGYFKAPVTADYTFFLACDDNCELSLSQTNLDPSAVTEIVSAVSGTSGVRKYWKSNDY